jgi:hypothetical protein
MDPTGELLELPAGYGRPKTVLKWPAVRAALEQAKHYWLGTVRSDGRPHRHQMRSGKWFVPLTEVGGP